MVYHKSLLLSNLINELTKFPGIGKKNATRLAFHIVRQDKSYSNNLIRVISEATENLVTCKNCFNLSENNPCGICTDHNRTEKVLCVVEQAQDIMTIEDTGNFQGKYHVLNGVISPVNGITPSELTIDFLIARVLKNNIDELIIATNPTLEGDSTALYIKNELDNTNTKITRIAMGLPAGSNIEFSDKFSLGKALSNRTEL